MADNFYSQIAADMRAIFTADEVADSHDINGENIKCVVHAAGIAPRGVSGLEMAADDADVVLIVAADAMEPPRPGSGLELDGERMQIERVSPIAGALIKIMLRRVF